MRKGSDSGFGERNFRYECSVCAAWVSLFPTTATNCADHVVTGCYVSECLQRASQGSDALLKSCGFFAGFCHSVDAVIQYKGIRG